MNNSEVLEKLRAYLKCRRRQVKGIYEDCNNKKCDNCDLCYMQGTVGEHIEAIEVATQALEKLQVYENLEEQGRLVKLPYKVGDDVYYILGIPNKTPCVINKCKFELSDINKIGKTLFLTREEAEAKLKELRGINSETNRNEIEEIER